MAYPFRDQNVLVRPPVPTMNSGSLAGDEEMRVRGDLVVDAESITVESCVARVVVREDERRVGIHDANVLRTSCIENMLYLCRKTIFVTQYESVR